MLSDPGRAQAKGSRRALRFVLPRGVPGYIRSDNGPEFIVQTVQDLITAVGTKSEYIAPGSP